MSQYVYLVKFTPQGIANIRDTVSRAEAFRALVSEMGGTVDTLLWTMGRYDLVCVAEAPDDETASAISVRVASLGNVAPETLRAFTSDEVSGIIGKLG